MKIKLTTEKTYSFEVGGRAFRDYRLISSWEGFAKYAKDASWLILYTGDDLFAGALESMFGATEYVIVSASLDISSAVKQAESQSQAGNAETVQ